MDVDIENRLHTLKVRIHEEVGRRHHLGREVGDTQGMKKVAKGRMRMRGRPRWDRRWNRKKEGDTGRVER